MGKFNIVYSTETNPIPIQFHLKPYNIGRECKNPQPVKIVKNVYFGTKDDHTMKQLTFTEKELKIKFNIPQR